MRKVLFTFLLLIFLMSSFAQTYQTWRSENTQNSWQDVNAWWNFPNNSPIVFGQQEWDNNVQLTQSNDADISTWRFLFKSNASSQHTFNGNQISFFDFGGLDPSITNESAATHNINNNIVADPDIADPLLILINNNSGGGFIFGGSFTNNSIINIEGNATASANITFNGIISGSGGLYKTNSNLTAILAANNSYSGQTTINAGVLRVTGSLGTGDVRIGSSGNLDIDNSTTVASVSEIGTGNGGTINIASGQTLTINGADKGTLYQNSISGDGGITMSGSGTTTLALYGTQDYTGSTTVSGGKITSGVILASTTFNISGGEMEFTSDNIVADAANFTISGNGLVDFQGNETINDISLSGTSTAMIASGKTLIISGTLTTSGFGGLASMQSINNGSNINVGNFGLLITTTDNLGNTTVKRGYHTLTANGNNSIQRWYEVTSENAPSSVTLIFPYTEGSELNGISESNLGLFKSEDGGSTWTLMNNQTLDTDNNTITVTGVSSFSIFTLGDMNSPLPVELTTFLALTQNNSVNLTWETATEVNNYGFEIERTTLANENSEVNSSWSKIGFVEGHGNSNSAKQYSYVDNSVRAGQSYSYRLKQIDFDGHFEYSSIVNVEVGVPMEFNLAQNYPNPFNPSTSIDYSVPSNEFVTLKVYDVLGNTVSTLVNETKEAGKYNVTFDASNLTSGIYFYSINAGGFTQVKKMMLVK